MRWHLMFLLFLLLPLVHANQVVGTVKLTVTNRPPIITSLDLLPMQPYSDSILTCTPMINDEHQGTVFLSYMWKINGIESPEKTGKLIGAKAGEFVSCEAFPTDEEGLPGESRSANTTILIPSTTLKITKSILFVLTRNATFEKSAEVSGGGFSGMTAYVVYENGGMPSLLGVIAVLLGVIFLLLLTIGLRRRRRH